MKTFFVLMAALLLLTACTQTTSTHTENTMTPHVLLETNKGTIELELNREAAPVSVANFLSYVEDGFYMNTVFHRVIDGFMVQGGGFQQATDAQNPEKKVFVRKDTRAPIILEAGLPNKRGTVALARTSDPNSATSQFFINTVDNDFLNPTPTNPGYAVFGKVVSGMDIVDAISKAPTGTQNAMVLPGQEVPMKDWPTETIVITKAYIK